MKNKVFYLLLAFLLLDTIFSFIQYLHLPLDGDMVGIILPSPWYEQVMKDPFAISVFTKGENYAATNRFFAHWTMATYFKTMPFFVQKFTDPINSLYISCAIVKIALHIFVLWLLATYIVTTLHLKKRYLVLAAALIAPFFQGSHFYGQIGLMDRSVTYIFFYLLPISLLLLYFLPFYKAFVNEQPVKLHLVQKILWVLLAVYLTLNGPLVPAIVLLLCPMVLAYMWFINLQNQPHISGFINKIFRAVTAIPGPVLFYFGLILALSLYSYYVGTFNAENSGIKDVSLADRYLLLPKGLSGHFLRLAAALIFFLLFLNYFIARATNLYQSKTAKLLVNLSIWAAIFSVIYLLLLPLGGYRPYRPYIVRYDTFIPVTICLMFLVGASTLYILTSSKIKARNFYLATVITILAVFTVSDDTFTDPYYRCEKDALRKIAASAENEVAIDNQCWILAWTAFQNPGDSETSSQMLQYW
ncbi:MAG: hypothetical protein EOO03_10290, partial [Chitinophagaceae bacterium]